MYDVLDYGSWAGEFSASGEAIYSSVTKSFEGIDYCSDEVYNDYPCNIEVKIPKDFLFEEIDIIYENSNVKIYIKTELEECLSFIKQIKKELTDKFNETFSELQKHYNFFDYSYNEFNFIKNECPLVDDFYILTIDKLQLTTYDNKEKKIILNISEI